MSRGLQASLVWESIFFVPPTSPLHVHVVSCVLLMCVYVCMCVCVCVCVCVFCVPPPSIVIVGGVAPLWVSVAGWE